MDQLLFRASSLGKLMTKSRSKTEPISATAKNELLKLYLQHEYKRTDDITSKYIDKGIAVESEAIDIWRRHTGHIVFKNETRFRNAYISGVPDLLVKKNDAVLFVPDIKSSWSLHTFYNSKIDDIDTNYFWQGQAYCWLVGAPYAVFVFVLCNATSTLLDDEKHKAAWRMGSIDTESPEYIARCKQIERNMIFDMDKFKRDYPYTHIHHAPDEWVYDIPVEKRIHEKVVQFDQESIDELMERVPMWREYVNKLNTI